MWREELDAIILEKKDYNEIVNRGATENEIEKMKENGSSELSITFPIDFLEILKVINGLEFNGTILYGVDENLLDNKNQIEQKIYGGVEYNKIWYEVETNKHFIFLGESNVSWYVYEISSQNYCEIDNPSGELINSYERFEDLFERMLQDALK